PRAQARTMPRFDASWAGNAPPPYPPVARRLGEQGEVRLDVHVGPSGRVLDVRLKRSSGSDVLDQTAIETVKKWRFRPATVDGQPVAEWYHDWKWVFKLES
ncbi:MAG TPA: energy transducer TonB, partial [Burkholderiaceae bacterium]